MYLLYVYSLDMMSQHFNTGEKNGLDCFNNSFDDEGVWRLMTIGSHGLIEFLATKSKDSN